MPTTHSAEITPFTRLMITVSLVGTMLMITLDSTIANVALPHMQGSVSASQDQIAWVLTSYIIASAIATPLTGWLARRFGAKTLYLVAIAGFTLSSALCGIAGSLAELVIFRLMQGAFGAVLIPLGQATLLDIYPPEQFGPAMAVFSLGVLLGPIMGPALGGWLTENFSWRWVFYINLPFGIASWLGLSIFLKSRKETDQQRLNIGTFAALALGVGAMQLMIDRGQGQDWFSSPEIWIEAIIALLGIYAFLALNATSERPFLDLTVFRNRNYAVATMFSFLMGVILFSTLALLPPMLEKLLGYPVVLTGLVTAPRGIGTMIAIAVISRLKIKQNIALMVAMGWTVITWSLWEMSNFTLDVARNTIIMTGFAQGVGIGMIFSCLTASAFSTLSGGLRTDGTAIYTLVRNLGSSIGISLMSAMQISSESKVHSGIVSHMQPTQQPGVFDLTTPQGVQSINDAITQQASMAAYADAFRLMAICCVLALPLTLFLRTPKGQSTEKEETHVLE